MSSNNERPPAPRQPTTKPSMPAARPPPLPRRDATDPPASADVTAALGRIEGNLATLVANWQQTNLRLTSVEERLDDVDGKLLATNAATRAPSTHDIAAQAQLAQERAAREALAAEVGAVKEMVAENTAATLAIRDAVVGFVTNKKLLIVGKALFVVAAGYLAGHGAGVLP